MIGLLKLSVMRIELITCNGCCIIETTLNITLIERNAFSQRDQQCIKLGIDDIEVVENLGSALSMSTVVVLQGCNSVIESCDNIVPIHNFVWSHSTATSLRTGRDRGRVGAVRA